MVLRAKLKGSNWISMAIVTVSESGSIAYGSLEIGRWWCLQMSRVTSYEFWMGKRRHRYVALAPSYSQAQEEHEGHEGYWV
jgi:hypothetical protein